MSSPSSAAANASSAAVTTSASANSSIAPITATITSSIVVDQFGYLPDAQKIAVIRDPQNGYDANVNFTPGASLSLVDLSTGTVVLTATPTTWNAGATHSTSGDRVWWFDFSSVTTPGTYAVVDSSQNVRSPGFTIGEDIYKPVLRHAFRTFFYQRAGFAKQQPFAETGWTDSASHLKSGQDSESRLYDVNNRTSGVAGTEKDLSGGWFDAGDYNKYTNWHADYLINLLHAYLENPSAWSDDFNIPESGNGVSDMIDEIRWGFEWLKRMQNSDGSVLSIQGLSHASPPSAATGRSFYGPASTSATLSTAAAFALGAKVLGDLDVGDYDTYAADLKTRAENAWTWANTNSNVIVNNNTGIYAGLGAGNQEVDDNGRATKKTRAAIYLFAATDNATYQNHVTTNYGNRANWVDIWNENELMSWLYYANLTGADTTLANTIKTQYANAMNGSSNLGSITNKTDAYRVHIGGDNNFTWGSNRSMSRKGTSFYNLISYGAGNANATTVKNASLAYLNYLHGTNPQGMVYLSNMYSLGVHSSVNEFYHTWFTNGSALWDRVGTSTFGPAPGFLVGGPNPTYDWDGNCTSNSPNPGCGTAAPNPPKGQPPMKAYLDFNTSWPLNSWQITENHNDYQVAYLRLLSKFVD
ncbi:MAG TPA: glycoside hydrolase family 9 protein [Cellvibrio sp.]|nr:glycoside hydrolase family 9 protein [Cellvibrio sp.]